MLNPPFDCPKASSPALPPAAPTGAGMSPVDGGVDKHALHIRMMDASGEQRPPNPMPAPAGKTLEHGVPVAMRFRQQTPLRSRSKSLQNGDQKDPALFPGRRPDMPMLHQYGIDNAPVFGANVEPVRAIFEMVPASLVARAHVNRT
ncbi:hypothetical protein RP726_07240 [Candidatus Methylospira mobilis]|nr:hypothetical protein [Candidatus Methylospira mobilis]WNV06199.1 hypothetical protein RP726_07240 [Candidatus Methylospira mobilis]